jgi:PAS domain S-box-containing protein
MMDAVALKTAAASPTHRRQLKGADDFFIRHVTLIAIAVLTILVLWAALIFSQQVRTTTVSRAWVEHTYEVRGHLRALLARVDNAVVGERDYLIGGREDDLDAYREATRPSDDKTGQLNPVEQELKILRTMTADNPAQLQRLDEIDRAIRQLLAQMGGMIELRRQQGAAALPKIDPYRGQQLLDHIRDLLTAMMEEENNLLSVRVQNDEIALHRYNLSVFLAIGIFYIVTVLAIRLCQKAERNAQAALRDSEQRYSLAVRGLSVGLWDWIVPSGKIYWSPRFMDIVGIADRNFSPTLDFVEKVLHPDDREATMAQLFGHIRSLGKIAYDNEARLRKSDGSYVWLHSRGQAVWDKTGNPLRMVGSVEDITARKESEIQIRRHVDALRQSNQELDDFAYIASHDLKEPLRGLTNNAMFIKEDLAGKIDDGMARRLDRMTYLCQRLERLVDDLLYFSRLGRQELAVQKTDLNEVIKDVRLTMESMLRDTNAAIVLPETLPTIVCDLPRVTEVFRNLIVNAVKYNKSAEKRIEIGCVAPAAGNGNDRAFYVRDNGIGIPAQFHADIFRIFKRLNEEDDTVKGTGVGLTFVRKIVERHGGRIWLESEVGKGTTFYFTLKSRKEAS